MRAVIPDRLAVSATWTAAFAPLVWIPGASNMWIFGKALATALAVLLGVAAGYRGGIPRRLLAVGLVGLTVVVATALTSGHTATALLGRAPRYEGVPMLALYAAALWLGTTLAPGSAAREALPDALSGAMLALGAATLAEVLGHNPLGLTAVRSGSLLGNATDQGLFAMLALVVLIGPAYARRDALLGLGATAAVFVLAVSGSRAALIGVAAAAIVLIASQGRRYALAAMLAPLAAVALAIAVPLTRARFSDGFSIDARFQIWGMTWHLFRDHLWTGVGASGYMDTIGRYETTAWAHGAGRDNAILNSPHSWVWQFAADAGLVGVALAIALAVVVCSVGVRAARREDADDLTPGLLAAVIAFGVGLATNFTIVGSTVPAAFLLGVLIAPSAARLPSRRRRAALMLSVAAVVVAASACVAEIAFTRGVHEILAGHPEAGSRAIDRARLLRPYDPDIATLASSALAGSSATSAQQAARRYAEISQRAAPGTYRSALALAITDVTARRYTDAIARLDLLVAAYPARALPLVHRGIAELRMGRTAAAAADFERARILAPHDREITELLDQTR